jgi:7-cyano-7-deazaguanine reductase
MAAMMYKNRNIDPSEAKAKKTAGKFSTTKDIDAGILATIDYEYPKRKINVDMVTDEFTCVCPYSGLPDFAKITIRYTPRFKLVELKSLKYYLYAFRNVKVYNEHVVNKILNDLTAALKPYEIEIIAEFTNRGGMKNTVTASQKSR